ncbi:MAG: hypothetical protein AAFQ59_19405 [Pseudomonadota bacterium]
MKPISLLIVAALVLAACSGSRNTVTRVAVPSQTLFATGPIYSACRAAGRDAASRARCGCVQAVADRELDAGDQRRGAGFFTDPHEAQVVRQSDRSIDERFWTRWRAYSDAAARICA